MALFCPLALADAIELEAIVDFPVIDAGEVPYYVDNARNALAINAAIVDYRYRFARAEHLFSSTSANYDLTLTTLGEFDGEGQYRIWVDGVLVGQAVNAYTDQSFDTQQFMFEDVPVASGSTLAVESMATSNGLVPENGEFAFARGRWVSLTLDETGEFTGALPAAGNVDLSIDLPTAFAGPAERVLPVSMTLYNASEDTVATGVSIDISLPDSLLASSSDCYEIDNEAGITTLRCPTEEIAPGATATHSLGVLGNVPGLHTLTAIISSDQQDSAPENNRAATSLSFSSSVEDTAFPSIDNEAEDTDEETSAIKISSGGAMFWLLPVLCVMLARRQLCVTRVA